MGASRSRTAHALAFVVLAAGTGLAETPSWIGSASLSATRTGTRAHVYFEEEPGRRAATRLTTRAADCREHREAAGATEAVLNCGRVHLAFICAQIMRRAGRLRGPRR